MIIYKKHYLSSTEHHKDVFFPLDCTSSKSTIVGVSIVIDTPLNLLPTLMISLLQGGETAHGPVVDDMTTDFRRSVSR